MLKLHNLLIVSVPTVLLLVSTVPAHAQESVDEDLKAGGRTIGGPGVFEATEGVRKRIADARTGDGSAGIDICVTVSNGDMGEVEIRIHPKLRDDFNTVSSAETLAVCQKNITTASLRCTSGDCRASWRVDLF